MEKSYANEPQIYAYIYKLMTSSMTSQCDTKVGPILSITNRISTFFSIALRYIIIDIYVYYRGYMTMYVNRGLDGTNDDVIIYKIRS